MSLQVVWTSKFKKDYKLAIKRGRDIDLLDNAIRLLASTKPLPKEYKTTRFSVIGCLYIASKKVFLFSPFSERELIATCLTNNSQDGINNCISV